ncbi:MAG: hypothetical protein CML56_03880 [Rhodobacteraceae bacterium]|nr:hypothetical protein [Paracoccaceae bacterium]
MKLDLTRGTNLDELIFLRYYVLSRAPLREETANPISLPPEKFTKISATTRLRLANDGLARNFGNLQDSELYISAFYSLE